MVDNLMTDNNILEKYNQYNNQYKISKDFFKSTIVHVIIIIIITIFSFLQTKLTLFKDKSSTGNLIENSTINIDKNYNSSKPRSDKSDLDLKVSNKIPVKASLVDPDMVNQAIIRQELQIKDTINRKKKVEQQEQQIAALKKAAEQETLKLKKEAQKAKEYNKQLQEEQKKLRQQADALLLEQKKLKQQAETLSLEQKKLKQQALNAELSDKKKNLKIPESLQDKSVTNVERVIDLTSNNVNSSNGLHNVSNMGDLGVIQSEINSYNAMWKDEIINNRKKIMFLPNGMTCAIRIKLLPNGHLALVKIEQSSGNVAYDKFSEQAIYKSAPFEMPQDPVLNKELTNTEHIIHFDEHSFSD